MSDGIAAMVNIKLRRVKISRRDICIVIKIQKLDTEVCHRGRWVGFDIIEN